MKHNSGIKYCILLLIIISGTLFAQLKTDDQPGEDFYKLIRLSSARKLPSEQALLTMKPSAIPPSIMDSLKKYDWVMIGGYGYADKTYYNYFDPKLFENENEKQYQFNFFRILDSNHKADFSVNKFKDQPSVVYTTSFSKSSAQVYEGIKKNTGSTYIKSVIYDSPEYLKLLSFKDNILIIDITKTGKVTDTKVMYRNVYVGIPKKFIWDFKE